MDDEQGPRGEALRVAKAMVRGTCELFVGLRQLLPLLDELDIGPDDEDFALFFTVAAEIEELPVGAETAVWDRRALAEAKRELQHAKHLYRQELLRTCRFLIQTLATERGTP